MPRSMVGLLVAAGTASHVRARWTRSRLYRLGSYRGCDCCYWPSWLHHSACVL
jgi:hypothetical protein